MQQQPAIDPVITERMKRDWDRRAQEDAHFYVAFGRRDQDNEEFFATAAEVVKGLEWELRRMPPDANRRVWRALEIGCGPGRLMKPMSRHFGEIHGIDVSEEMIRRARANLSGIPHAHVHHTSGADLAPFADESFDFVYSYAVFQHIPSREVVMQYLTEATRVLRPGGLLRAQINGLDQTAKQYDTWSGVRIAAQEIRDFAREHRLQLLALEGTRTQYMWTTMRKPAAAQSEGDLRTRIRRITNANNSEPVSPASGRFASVTLWVEHLPSDCDLNNMKVIVGEQAASPCYIGPPEAGALQQVNVILPALARTGLLPVELQCAGHSFCSPTPLRVIPAGPAVPRLICISDGIDMLSATRIVSGTIKATIEETESPDSFSATVDGVPVTNIDAFCVDPLPPRFEINFHLPAGLPRGGHMLELRLGRRLLGYVPIEIAQ